MPKQNRYKNRFKSVGSSSIAPGPSSQLQPQAHGSLAPGQSSQAQASLGSGKSSHLQPQAQGSSFSSYQASLPSSSSDEVSSQPAIPSAANGSKRTKRKDDENDRDWLVDVIDEHQVTRQMRLKLRNVHNLDNKSRIIVEFDEYGAPIGKLGGLIAGILGQLATNPLYFPIGFVKWSDMPDCYFDRVFDEILTEKIQEIRSQRSETIADVSPNDALGIVLGPEHPGRVRGLGMGVVPTIAFRQRSRRGGRVNVGSSSTPTPQWQQNMTNMRSQLNALVNLYQRNIGNIPEVFAHLFPPLPQASSVGIGAQSPNRSNNDDGPSVD